MAEQWFIRVHQKEYGPVDLKTLREWKAEGRLIPQNPARLADADLWTTAAEIPDLFHPAKPAPLPTDAPCLPRSSFARIIAESVRVYRKRFFTFLSLALLVTLPPACAQLATAWFDTTQGVNIDLRNLVIGSFTFCMFIGSVVLWPIYIAGVQILAAETFAGHRIGFFATLNEAVRFWPRVAALCLFVYAIFFLLTIFGVAIALMILAGGASFIVIFFALALLALQVWMFGRFFINVLFWQQFAVLENAGLADSLHESKILARGGRDLPWYRRPWWRGGLIVSIWVAFVLTITVVPQWPTLREYWTQMIAMQDSQLLLEKLKAIEQARGFNYLGFGLSVFQKLLQPLLGIAFVVLYIHTKQNHEA